MRKTTWAWVSPLALLAALALAGCGGGGGGGGGGGSNNNNGGGGGASPFVVTITPGHGYNTLSWTGAPVGTTSYTIQRATASAGPYVSLPNPTGNIVFSTAGTTYRDAEYANATSNGTVNVADPVAGTQYFYKVVAAPGGTTTDPTAQTPLGPSIAQSTSIPPASSGNVNQAAAPFNMSDSGTHFTYTVSQANPTQARVNMVIVLDYNASVSDLRNITVNITGTDQIISETALASNGTTYGTGGIAINPSNPREIDVDTSKVPSISIPVAPSYSLVSLNAYVRNVHNGTDANAVPVGIGAQLQGVGVDETGTLPTSSAPYAGQFHFDLRNQTTGT